MAFNRKLALVLLDQELARLNSKYEHHNGRIVRGTADDEDETCVMLYWELRNDLSIRRRQCALAIEASEWPNATGKV